MAPTELFEMYVKNMVCQLFNVIYCIWVTNKIRRKKSIFYTAISIGKDSRLFKMYKFYLMKVNALVNADGSTYNSKDDPR